MRDMTKAQFEKALIKNGWNPQRKCDGYYLHTDGVMISAMNSGSEKRRTQLAYLINAKREYDRAVAARKPGGEK